MRKKTLLQQVYEIDRDAAEFLVKNVERRHLIGGEVDGCMFWDKTPQGVDFWGDVAVKIREKQSNQHPQADILRALADDKDAAIEYKDRYGNWILSLFPGLEIRIKPKPVTKRARMCRLSNGVIVATQEDLSDRDTFKQWLGDWQEYEV